MEKIINYLDDDKYMTYSEDSKGISMELDKDELLIKGSKSDLIELANYILNVALSTNNNEHLHLDDLTLIDEKSIIKKLIIEKDE